MSDSEYPRLWLYQGAHCGCYAEDVGGVVCRITQYERHEGEDFRSESVVLGQVGIQRLLEWMKRDRKAEERERVRKSLKPVTGGRL